MRLTLAQALGLSGNPFEHYTAETEPDIAEYAVRPPYLQAISDRFGNLSSFILFGDRGAGKSATRITVFAEAWRRIADHDKLKKYPFVVNLTDFTNLMAAFKADALGEKDLVSLVAFVIVEQMLVWLSSLEDEERTIFIEGLDQSERALAFALVRGFYLSVPELDRDLSTSEAMKLLNGAWTTKSALWIGRRWDSLAKIVATAVSALSKREIAEMADISAPAEALLKSLVGESPSVPRAIMSKLVDFVKAFGFSGVAVLIDKVDETSQTSKSAAAASRLIFPLVSNVHLLEVAGFCWIQFLWSKVRDHFQLGNYEIRLDKLAHSNITWTSDSLLSMLDSRIEFFSKKTKKFFDIFDRKLDAGQVFADLVAIASNSPRELIKLLDTIVREHDSRYDEAPPYLDELSIEAGTDKYTVETVGGFFEDKFLQQTYRVGKLAFVNRDVQGVFKIGDQSARAKIKNWEDIGLVKQSGTQTSSELGGQPAYRYVIADARVKRIIERKLVDTVGVEIESGDL